MLRRPHAESLEGRRLLAFGPVELVSVNADGTASGDRASYGSAAEQRVISDDGRFQVFASDARDLVVDDDNNSRDVFLRDLRTGVTTLVSRGTDGTSAQGSSDDPTISGDGRFVVFVSGADDLDVTGVNGTGFDEIFRYTIADGTIELVSINRDGDQGGAGGASDSPSVNVDGSRIAFRSAAENLVSDFDDRNGSGGDIYIRDMTAGTTTLVSHAAGDISASGNRDSFRPTITRDGNRIVYVSDAGNLEGGITDVNGSTDDLVSYDVATGLNTYVTVQTAETVGANADLSRTTGSLSSDGTWQAFTSSASNLVDGDTNQRVDVFIANTITGEVRLVSRAFGGGGGNGSSSGGRISADGRYVVFVSDASDIDIGEENESLSQSGRQVYRYEMATGTIKMITTNAAGTGGGNNTSDNPTISGDGSRVAFHSAARDLVTGITDINSTTFDVFAWTAGEGTRLVSFDAAVPTQTAESTSDNATISRDGSRIVYQSQARNLQSDATDGNGAVDIVVYTFPADGDDGPGVNEYVNVLSTDPFTGNSSSTMTEQSLSEDGRYQVFSSRSYNLVPGDTNRTDDVFLRDLQTGQTTLVSRGIDGPADGSSTHAVISADGNFVAFQSTARNLDVTGPSGTTGNSNVYRWQRTGEDAGEIRLISVNAAQTGGANSSSGVPSINVDGDRIAFATSGSDLINGVNDLNGTSDIYLRQVTAGLTTLVSVADREGSTTGNFSSYGPVISRDGGRVTYFSQATDLESGVTDINQTVQDIVSYDVADGTNRYVSVQTDVITSNNGGVSGSVLSADGRYEAFTSFASNQVPGDVNFSEDVFLRDHQTGTTTLVSRSTSGSPAGSSGNPDIAVNDEGVVFVSFESTQPNLDVTGTNTTSFNRDIFRYRHDTGEIVLVSVNADDSGGGNSTSSHARLSGDGNRVVFESGATTLVPGTSGSEIFVRDVASGATTLVSRDASNPTVDGNSSSTDPEISRDGSTIVFLSSARNLSPLDDSSTRDLYAYDVAAGTVELVSVNATGDGGTNSGFSAGSFEVSADGNVIAFESNASNLHPDDDDTTSDVFVRDRAAGITELISVNLAGNDSGNGSSASVSLDDDGRYVAFSSTSTDLATFDGDPLTGVRQIYVRDRGTDTVAASTTLASVFADETAGGNVASDAPILSGDGSTVIWQSGATNLSEFAETVGQQNVFRRRWNDVDAFTEVVSQSSETVITLGHNGTASVAGISDDGSAVSLFSVGFDLGSVPAISGGTNLYRAESFFVTLTNVTDGSRYTVVNGATDFDVSDDGRDIAFVGNSPGLVPVPVNFGISQVYVRRLDDGNFGGQTQLVSISTDDSEIDEAGLPGNGSGATRPAISGDGSAVAFVSTSTNLTTITGGFPASAFVRDLDAGVTTLASLGKNDSGDPRQNDESVIDVELSRDGNVVVFQSAAENLLDDDTTFISGQQQLFARDWRSADPTTTLVSRSGTGGVADAGTERNRPLVTSGTGETIAFESVSTNLDADVADTNRTADVFAFTGDGIQTVSASDGGIVTSPSGASFYSIDDDASAIAFISVDGGFTDDVVRGFSQVVLRDVEAGTNEFISVAANGWTANNTSISPSVDGSGRFVAFTSFATNLPGGTGNSYVYVRDRGDDATAASTNLISVRSDGTGATGSDTPVISRDGSVVAFQSTDTTLVPDGVTDTANDDVFLRDWRSPTASTRVVSTAADGSSTADRGGTSPTLDDDGDVVIFASTSSDLVDGVPQLNFNDLYVSRSDVVSQLVTSTGGGFNVGHSDGDVYDVSDDGRYVAFTSAGPGPTPDDNRSTIRRAYRRDVVDGVTELASISQFDDRSASSDDVSLSGDGRYLAFRGDIVANGREGILVRDLVDATTTVVSVPADGSDTIDSTATNPVISDDGRIIAFESGARNLDPNVPGDNGNEDVFAVDWLSGDLTAQLLSIRTDGLAGGNSGINDVVVSRDGSAVAFRSSHSNVVAGDINGTNNDWFVTRGIGLVVTPPRVNEGDEGTTDLDFEITLLGATQTEVLVGFSVDPGTASANDDFLPVAGFLTFDADNLTQTVTVTVIGDTLGEDDETVLLTLIESDGADIITPITVGTIVNDDSSISIGDATVVEGDNGQRLLAFPVTQSPVSAAEISVDFATSDGTATAGEDYAATAGTFTLPAGQASGVIEIPVIGDTTSEAFETFIVTLSNPIGTEIDVADATGTIANDEAVLSIDADAFNEGDTSTRRPDAFVRLSHRVAGPVTFAYATSDGTATADDDYIAATGTATIAAGSLSARVPLAIVGDRIAEPNETFMLTLSDITGLSVGTVTQTFAILDDDVELDVDDVSIVEGDAGTVDAVFTLTLSQPSPIDVTMQVQTANGGAVGGVDYATLPLTDVTIPAGQTETTVTVTVNGDTDLESDESFFVNLSNVVGAVVVDSQARGIIVDDDDGVSIADAAVTEGDDGTVTLKFDLTLSAASGGEVTVDFAVVDGTAIAGEDYEDPGVVAVTFAPGQTTATVDVTVNGDATPEPFETLAASLSNIVGANIADGTATGTIRNDDAELTLSARDALEGTASSGVVRFDIDLTHPVVDDITVTRTIAAGTATADDDFLPVAPAQILIAAGTTRVTVPVATVADSTSEPHETILATISDASDGVIAVADATGRILNDDAAIRIVGGTIAEGDSGQTPLTFTITLDHPVAIATSVDLSTVDGIATAGEDYVAVDTRLTLPVDQTALPFDVAVIGDAVFESDETFTLGISNPSGGTIEVASAEAVIADDDGAAPDLVVDPSGITFGEITPGSPLSVTWTTRNAGNEAVAGGWDEHVYLVAAPAPGETIDSLDDRVLIGTIRRRGPLAAETAADPRTGNLTVPTSGPAGNVALMVVVDANREIPESDESNRFVSDATGTVEARLGVAIDRDTVHEGRTATMVVTRNGSTRSALSVTITGDDSRLAFPATVVIPAGRDGVSVPITAIDDDLSLSDVDVTLAADADGFTGDFDAVRVVDIDRRRLTLAVEEERLSEGDAATITVSHNGPDDSDVTVRITVFESDEVTLPRSVTIPAGSRSIDVEAGVVDDDRFEAVDVVLVSAGTTGYESATLPIAIETDDVPVVTLDMPGSVVESGAASGRVVIDRVRRHPVTVRLTVAGDAFTLPAVVIPAGQLSAAVAVFGVDNDDVDAPRTATITATPSPDANTPGITVAASTAEIAVVDDDGPTLGLSINRAWLPESGTAELTVTRNVDSDNDLVVTIAADPTGQIELPATITIPGGSRSATVDVAGTADGVSDGDVRVSIAATADGFNPGPAAIVVSDIDRPDLIVTDVAVPETVSPGVVADLAWNTVNVGVAAVPVAWTEGVYLSRDRIIDPDDLLLTTIDLSGPLAVGVSALRRIPVRMPQSPGEFFVLVQTDIAGAVREGSETNNVGVSAGRVTIPAPYSATADVESESFGIGDVVPIVGVATRTDGTPAADVPLVVTVRVDGVDRRIPTRTDGDGDYAVTFTPIIGEGGEYSVAATHPDVAPESFDDAFRIAGLRPVRGNDVIAVTSGQTITPEIGIDSVDGTVPGNLTVTATEVTDGLAVTPTITGEDGSLTLTYDLSAAAGSPPRGSFTLRVTGDGVETLDIPIAVETIAPAARLVAAGGTVTASMVVGEQTSVEFTVENRGGAATGPLNLLLPEAAPWIASAVGTTIDPIPAGGSRTIPLLLTPSLQLPLTTYRGTVVLGDGDTDVAIDFDFRAVAETTGDLRVTVVDERFYFTDETPLVNTATVVVRDPVTRAAVASSADAGSGASGGEGEGPTVRVNDDGTIDFGSLPRGRYLVDITSPDHDPTTAVVIVPADGLADEQLFISRNYVEYTWEVTEVEVEDRTRVTLEAVFQTNVPAPVVVVESDIDLTGIDELNQTEQFTLTYTNHGFIQVTDVEVEFTDHPFYDIIPLVDVIPVLPAKSTIQLPVTVVRKATFESLALGEFAGGGLPGGGNPGAGNPGGGSTGGGDPMIGPGDIPCGVGARVRYRYECGPNGVIKRIPIPVPGADGYCPPGLPSGFSTGGGGFGGFGGFTGGGGGGGGGFGGGGGSSNTGGGNRSGIGGVPPGLGIPVFCDDCLTAVGDAAVDYLKDKALGLIPYADEIGQVIAYGGAVQDLTDLAVNGGNGRDGSTGQKFANAAKVGLGFVALVPSPWGLAARGILAAWSLYDTALPILQACTDLFGGGGGGEGESVGGGITRDAIRAAGADLRQALADFETLAAPERYLFGNTSLVSMTDVTQWEWVDLLKRTIIDVEEQNFDAITDAQVDALKASPVRPSAVTDADIDEFVARINRTVEYYDQGIFDAADVPEGQSTDFIQITVWRDLMIDADAKRVELETNSGGEAFADVVARLDASVTAILNALNAHADDGVCAEVRLRITQDVVQMRQGFEATLGLNNQTIDDLEEVDVDVIVLDTDGNDVTDLFGVTLLSQENLDLSIGTTTLPAGQEGEATWLLVPSGDAAPDGPVEYFVAGSMRYLELGVPVETTFLPTRVTVLPQPELTLNYFWQRDVIGDDPFTDAVEPSVPFTLGVQVRNDGGGAARELRIESSQPEIIENEKGLLVNFEIISTAVDGRPAERTLTAQIGDLAPGGISTATWQLESTLQGLFTEYTASFEHISDFGRPDLSLVRDVTIHELIRSIDATTSGVDDEIADFLVNDVPDPRDTPDTLYLSDGSVADVGVGENPSISSSSIGPGDAVGLTVTMPEGWGYTSFDDPTLGGLDLVAVRRGDGTELPATAFWQTDRTFIGLGSRPILEDRIHLVDFDSGGSYELVFGDGDDDGPSIVEFIGVGDEPLDSSVDFIEVRFDETIDPASVTAGAFDLLVDGAGLDLPLSVSVTGPSTVRVDDLTVRTGDDAVYELVVDLTRLTDRSLNPGVGTESLVWVKGESAPAVAAITGVDDEVLTAPIDAVTVRMTEPVDIDSLSEAIAIAADDVPIDTGSVAVELVEGSTYRITGLSDITDDDAAYVLSINATSILDPDGNAGVGSRSVAWRLDTTGPRIVEVVPPPTDPRNIVVQRLDVRFDEPIDLATLSTDDFTLIRDGGNDLIGDDPRITFEDRGDGVVRIGGINWVQGFVADPQIATFTFTFDPSGIADPPGNVGTGDPQSTSWTIDLESPNAPTEASLSIDSIDWESDSRPVAVYTGTVDEDGLTLVIEDGFVDAELFRGGLNDRSFSIPITLIAEGRNELTGRLIDPAGNTTDFNLPTTFATSLPPVVVDQSGLSPSIRRTAVQAWTVTFAQPLDAATFTPDALTIRRDGVVVPNDDATTVETDDSRTFTLTSLAAPTNQEGRYELTIDLSRLTTAAGRAGSGTHTASFTVDKTPPRTRIVAEIVSPEDGTYLVGVDAEVSDDVRVYVATPDRPLRIAADIEDGRTSFEFTGDADTAHRFFAAATDAAGNRAALIFGAAESDDNFAIPLKSSDADILPDVLRVAEGTPLSFLGDWATATPGMIDGKFVHRVVAGDHTLELYNTTPYRNPIDDDDVIPDGHIDPIDALEVLNRLRRVGSRAFDLGTPTPDELADHQYPDTDGDGRLSPLDALRVLNRLRRERNTAGGESASSTGLSTFTPVHAAFDDALPSDTSAQRSGGDRNVSDTNAPSADADDRESSFAPRSVDAAFAGNFDPTSVDDDSDADGNDAVRETDSLFDWLSGTLR